jgi:Mg-chelatase subunit ChlD
LTILLVDASGSMGRDAVRTAKATAVGLLDAAYQRRDEVAIVLARGTRAVLGLAPTRSRAKALHCLRRLPAGGGTPLADALLLAAGLAERYDTPAVELVIFTDGRANVGVGGDPRTDAARAASLASARCGTVRVIEPNRSSRFGRDGSGWLAEALGAGSGRRR